MVIICPVMERSFPISITARPVTHTAEAEEKRASIKEIWPRPAEKGSQRRRAPMRITEAKLKMNIFCGENNLDKIFFMLKKLFMNPVLSNPL
jgi:hypothetical protein